MSTSSAVASLDVGDEEATEGICLPSAEGEGGIEEGEEGGIEEGDEEATEGICLPSGGQGTQHAHGKVKRY